MARQSTTFTLNMDVKANISSAQAALQKLGSTISGMNFGGKMGKQLDSSFGNLQSRMNALIKQSEKGFSKPGDFNKWQSEYSALKQEFQDFSNLIQELRLDPQALIPSAIGQNLDKIDQKMQKHISRQKEIKDLEEQQKKLTKERDSLATKISKAETGRTRTKEDIKSEINEWKHLEKAIQSADKSKKIKGTDKTANEIINSAKQSGKTLDVTEISNKITSLRSELEKPITNNIDIANLDKNRQELEELDSEIESISKKKINLEIAQKNDLQTARQELEKFLQDKDQLSNKKIDLNIDTKNLNLEEIKDIYRNIGTEEAISQLEKLEKQEQETASVFSNMEAAADHVDSLSNSFDNLTRRERDLENLKNQVLSFFSVGNGVQVFKRMIRQAVDTISDLDKAMTETAVVTDFSVSDMWGRLREYTDLANELGATTQGAYETMTLYYQQGLDTKASFALGEETMKMARIAGMDYAEATDMMTAALRGFNMELNQTSAQHINDVYSELAAITASDTYEISEAMTRTASIAASAGLDFDIASAYLAEAIETTREAPENIGTAMKTIVARFAGLTKDPSELSQDMQDALEGEVVEANRVEAALRAAGVSARDSNGEFRNLSDVFLELNSKWDSLDLMTQRYVATQAAGTRQQSRFIAMMQNYDRTLELVNAAQNSTGSSQKQFEKTLDSMEAKVNKLKNAWNEFLMNIANSDMVKTGVDALTNFLNLINKTVDTLSKPFKLVGLDGIVKSLLNIAAIIGGGKLGASILSGDFLRGAIGKGHTDKKFGLAGYTETMRTGAENRRKVYVERNMGGWNRSTQMAASLEEQAKNNAQVYNSALMQKINESAKNKAFKKDLAKNFALSKGDFKTFSKSLESMPEIARQQFAKTNLWDSFINQYKSHINSSDLKDVYKPAVDSILKNAQKDLENGVSFDTIFNNLKRSATTITGKEFDFKLPENNFTKISSGLQTISNGASNASASFMELGDSLGMMGFDKLATLCYTLGGGLNLIASASAAAAAMTSSLGIATEGLTVSQIANNVVTAIGSVFKTAYAIAIFLATAATKGLTVATEALNKSLNGTKLGIIIAAIGLLVGVVAGATVGIVKLGQTIKSNLDGSAELEKTAAAATQAQAVLNETQNAYNKLSEGKTNLEELQSGFDGLVEGTNAWNEQMLKTNSTIIELCNQFPELLQYTKTLSNGLMEIKPEGLKAILEEQNKALTTASAVNTIASGREAQAQGKVDAYKFQKTDTDGWTKNDQKKYENILQQGTQNYLSAIETAMTTTVSSNDDVATEYTEGVSRILSEQYESMVQSELASIQGMSKKQIKNNWAEANGWTWKEDDTYINDATGAEQEFDFKTVKTQLADVNALDKASAAASRLSNELSNADNISESLFGNLEQKGTDTSKVLSKILGKDSTLDKQIVKQLTNYNTAEELVKNYREKTNNDDKFAQALADYLGVNVNEVSKNLDYYQKQLTDTINTNAYAIANSQKLQASQLAEKLAKTQKTNKAGYDFKSATSINKRDEKNISKFINKLTTSQQNLMNSIASQIENNLGLESMDTFLNSMQNLYSTFKSGEDLTKAEDWISTLDFSNPIALTKELKSNLESSNDAIKQFAKSMLESEDAIASNADQLQYFLNSTDFSDLNDSINEFIDANGEVTADNIRELTDESSTLQTVMDNTGISATALGMIFTQMGSQGTLAVTDITEAFLALISGIGQFDDMAVGLINHLNDFDPGVDYGEAADKINEFFNTAKEYFDNGEYGNPQLQNYLKELVGPEAWESTLKKYGGDLQKAEKELFNNNLDYMSKLNTSGEAAGIDGLLWKAVDNKKLNKALAKTSEDGLRGIKASIKDNRLDWDVGDLGTNEIVKRLQDAYKVSSTTAQAMLTEMANYSETLAATVEKNDIINSLKKTGDNSFVASLQKTFKDADGTIKEGTALLSSDVQHVQEVLQGSNMDSGEIQKYWSTVMKGIYGKEGAQIEIPVDTETGELNVKELEENIKSVVGEDYEAIINVDTIESQKDVQDFQKELNNWTKGQTNGKQTNWASQFSNRDGTIDAIAMARELRNEYGKTDSEIQQIMRNWNFDGQDLKIGDQIVDQDNISGKIIEAVNEAEESDQYEQIGESIADGIIEGIEGRFSSYSPRTILDKLGYKIGRIIEKIGDKINNFLNFDFSDAFDNLKDSAAEAGEKAWDKLKEWFTDPATLFDDFSGLVDKGIEWGEDLLEGIKQAFANFKISDLLPESIREGHISGGSDDTANDKFQGSTGTANVALAGAGLAGAIGAGVAGKRLIPKVLGKAGGKIGSKIFKKTPKKTKIENTPDGPRIKNNQTDTVVKGKTSVQANKGSKYTKITKAPKLKPKGKAGLIAGALTAGAGLFSGKIGGKAGQKIAGGVDSVAKTFFGGKGFGTIGKDIKSVYASKGVGGLAKSGLKNIGGAALGAVDLLGLFSGTKLGQTAGYTAGSIGSLFIPGFGAAKGAIAGVKGGARLGAKGLKAGSSKLFGLGKNILGKGGKGKNTKFLAAAGLGSMALTDPFAGFSLQQQNQTISTKRKNRFGQKGDSLEAQGRKYSAGGGGKGAYSKTQTVSTKNAQKDLTTAQKLQGIYKNLFKTEKDRSNIGNKISKNNKTQVVDTNKISKNTKQTASNSKKQSKTTKQKLNIDTKGTKKQVSKAIKGATKTKTKLNVDAKGTQNQVSKAVKKVTNAKTKLNVDAKDTKTQVSNAIKGAIGKGKSNKVKIGADTSKLDNIKKSLKGLGDKKVKVGISTPGSEKLAAAKTNLNKLQDKKVKAQFTTPGSGKLATAKTNLNALKDKTITVTIKRKGSIPKTGDNAFGKNLSGSSAFGSMAFGSVAKAKRGKLGPKGKGGTTLTGELGPELVWEPNKSESYLVGVGGPELVDLPGNAVVWPHNQTKNILNGQTHKSVSIGSSALGSNFGSADLGIGNPFKSSSGTGSVNATNKKSKKAKGKSKKNGGWENELDKYYNLQKKINKEIRLRNNLEKKYNILLESGTGSFSDLIDNLKDRFAQIADTIKDAADMMDNKAAQAEEIEDKTIKKSAGKKKKKKTVSVKMSDYAFWDEESKSVQINYDNLEQLEKNSKKKGNTGKAWTKVAELVQEYIDKLEEYEDAYEDAEDNLLDAQEEQITLLKEIRDQGIEGEHAIVDMIAEVEENAIEAQQEALDAQQELLDNKQEEIDKLSDIQDSVDDANERILAAINKSIKLQRRNEDNADTEEDLGEKERRLAYLKQDTSGANDLEIKQLEEELQNAQKDYQRELEDQALEDLEDTMDEASKQRERMIELMQKQLDAQQKSLDKQQELLDKQQKELDKKKETGGFNELMEKFLKDYDPETGTIDPNSELMKYIMNTDEWKAATSDAEREAIIEKWEKAIAQILAGREIGGASGNLAGVRFSDVNGHVYKASEDLSKDVTYKIGNMEYTVKFKRDKDGKLERDANNKPIIESITGTSTSDNGDGTKTTTNIEKDPITGVITKKSSTTVDDKGNVKSVVEETFNNAGNLSQRVTTGETKIENGRGKRNVKTQKFDENGNELDSDDYDEYNIPKNSTIYSRKGKKGFKYKTTVDSAFAKDGETIDLKDDQSEFTGLTYDEKSDTWHTTDQAQFLKYIKKPVSGKNLSKNSSKQMRFYSISKIAGSDGYTWPKEKLQSIFKAWNSSHKKKADKIGTKTNVYKGGQPSNILYTGSKSKKNAAKALKAKGYKTGGLADYTGPAWLDGTPSKPELVLNSTDTSNLIQLKDILSDIMKNNGMSTTNTANSSADTYNISVNVAEVSNDYDVKQMAEQIKKEITKASKYRNVTNVNRLR